MYKEVMFSVLTSDWRALSKYDFKDQQHLETNYMTPRITWKRQLEQCILLTTHAWLNWVLKMYFKLIAYQLLILHQTINISKT